MQTLNVLPKSLIKICIRMKHSPHFVVKKTYQLIEEKYYMYGTCSDTKDDSDNCSYCLQNNYLTHNAKCKNIPKEGSAPEEYLLIDTVGKLSRSSEGKFYILNVIHHYCRFFMPFISKMHPRVPYQIISRLFYLKFLPEILNT